ncbi:MAG: response regulator [Chloroflexi bacterium]|nr:response regulator [Chloroflexota bacterium]
MSPAILYIEDSPSSRKMMQILICDIMRYEHFAVLESTDCLSENIEAFGLQFDIILLDLDIQPIDGYRACQLLKADPQFKNTRIIAITAYSLTTEIHKMQEMGFDGALSKPISYIAFPEKLLSILNGESVWEIE